MARQKEYRKAKTCIHAKKVSPLNMVFITRDCPKHEGAVKLKEYYVIKANKCDACEAYKDRWK